MKLFLFCVIFLFEFCTLFSEAAAPRDIEFHSFVCGSLCAHVFKRGNSLLLSICGINVCTLWWRRDCHSHRWMRENFPRLNLCVFWTVWWPRPSTNLMSAPFCGRTIAKTICQKGKDNAKGNAQVGGPSGARDSRIIYNLSGNKVVCASAQPLLSPSFPTDWLLMHFLAATFRSYICPECSFLLLVAGGLSSLQILPRAWNHNPQ